MNSALPDWAAELIRAGWLAGLPAREIAAQVMSRGYPMSKAQLEWQRRRLKLPPRAQNRFTSANNPAYRERRARGQPVYSGPQNGLSFEERKRFIDGLANTGMP